MINTEYNFDWTWWNKELKVYCIKNDLHYVKLLKERWIHPQSISYQMNKEQKISEQVIEKIKKIKEVDYKKYMGRITERYKLIDLPKEAKELMTKPTYYYYLNKKNSKIRESIWKKYLSNKKQTDEK